MCENSGVEERKVESGGVLGKRGSKPPPHQLGGLRSAVSSPSRVWGKAPAEIEFGAFWP